MAWSGGKAQALTRQGQRRATERKAMPRPRDQLYKNLIIVVMALPRR